jgi:hypothetical protein
MMRSTRKVGQKSQRPQSEESTKSSFAKPHKRLKKAGKAGKAENGDKYENTDLQQKEFDAASEINLFSLSASLNEVLRPISEQKGNAKKLLQNAAQDSFEKSVPYVFSYSKNSKLNVVFDLEGYADSVYRHLPHEKQTDLISGVWKNNFSGARFYAFLDDRSSAIPLGSISDLRKKGFTEENLFDPLLTPAGEPRKAQALFLFLSEENLINKKFKTYENFVRRELDSNSILDEKEELLIDFAGSSSSILLKKLLDQKVSPDAFSPLFGVHAINVAKGHNREENVKLLIRYGANPDAEEQEPAC